MRKDAEERRNEIIDAADMLFAQKGFDGTSTNDILENVGIARGTLYHHFKSKEDIMDALIDRYSDRLLSGATEIAENKDIPVLDRILHVVRSMSLSGGSSEEIMDHIHRPQNALMHQKIQRVIIQGLTPILTGMIREGIELGMFNTPFPYECMEMVVTYANTVFDDDLIQMTNEERGLRIQAFVFNVERLLGAESGSLMDTLNIFAIEDENING
ncbi:AcrR family transcriptional regulator [Sporosarcina luteola]|nr:AcrR family transcriptional regulator [Sporosarcina luteola]